MAIFPGFESRKFPVALPAVRRYGYSKHLIARHYSPRATDFAPDRVFCREFSPRNREFAHFRNPAKCVGGSRLAAGEAHGRRAGAVVGLDVDKADHALLDLLPGALQGRADALRLFDIFGVAA